ncbi:MAG: hypothetical protein M1416_02790 [Candidatus Pacearchaeota archaeon]|nr:hypothetical protein [Candidatus Pacearchaeota archaeon]
MEKDKSLFDNSFLPSVSVVSVADLEKRRKILLDKYKAKQPFRVTIGKSRWMPYETFNPAYNLREILLDEVVIEFDIENKDLALEGINLTATSLHNARIKFEIWEHGGKSPHLHVHNLPITHLSKEQLRAFKKFFIKKFVPAEYLPYVDFSLCGTHLIALEWANHWKGCYKIKTLIKKVD